MNRREPALLQAEIGDVTPRLCLRTDTRVDVGGWIRNAPAWLCLTAEHVIVLAAGRRPYSQAIPLAEAAASTYCHASGTLVIAPTETLKIHRLAMSPADAIRVLNEMKTEISNA